MTVARSIFLKGEIIEDGNRENRMTTFFCHVDIASDWGSDCPKKKSTSMERIVKVSKFDL